MLHGQQLKDKADRALAEGRGICNMTAEEFAGFMVTWSGLDGAIEHLARSSERAKGQDLFCSRALAILRDARLHDETFDPYVEDEPVIAPPDEEVDERRDCPTCKGSGLDPDSVLYGVGVRSVPCRACGGKGAARA